MGHMPPLPLHWNRKKSNIPVKNVDFFVKPLPYKYSNKWHLDYGRAIFVFLKSKIRGDG